MCNIDKLEAEFSRLSKIYGVEKDREKKAEIGRKLDQIKNKKLLLMEARAIASVKALGGEIKTTDPPNSDDFLMMKIDDVEYKIVRSWNMGMDIYVHHDATAEQITRLKEAHKNKKVANNQTHIIFHCLEHVEKLIAIYDQNENTGYHNFEIIPEKERCK